MGAYQVSDLILIDTDILIDAARQINEAVDFLTKVERQFVLTISVITHMELLIGCRNKTELRNTDRFSLLSGKRLFYPYMGEQGVFAPTFSGVTRASQETRL
jgi:predicted nucleic acid-binding protein